MFHSTTNNPKGVHSIEVTDASGKVSIALMHDGSGLAHTLEKAESTTLAIAMANATGVKVMGSRVHIRCAECIDGEVIGEFIGKNPCIRCRGTGELEGTVIGCARKKNQN